MLKEYRLKKGLTQEELAEMCNISWRNLVRIENGNYPYTKFETIAKILIILEVPENEIMKILKETSGLYQKV